MSLYEKKNKYWGYEIKKEIKIIIYQRGIMLFKSNSNNITKISH